jgi:hypothetical protein
MTGRAGQWRPRAGPSLSRSATASTAGRFTRRLDRKLGQRLRGPTDQQARAGRRGARPGSVEVSPYRHLDAAPAQPPSADDATRGASLRAPRASPTDSLFETVTIDDPTSLHLDGAVVLVMELAADSLDNVLSRHATQPIHDAPRMIAGMCEGWPTCTPVVGCIGFQVEQCTDHGRWLGATGRLRARD